MNNFFVRLFVNPNINMEDNGSSRSSNNEWTLSLNREIHKSKMKFKQKTAKKNALKVFNYEQICKSEYLFIYFYENIFMSWRYSPSINILVLISLSCRTTLCETFYTYTCGYICIFLLLLLHIVWLYANYYRWYTTKNIEHCLIILFLVVFVFYLTSVG